MIKIGNWYLPDSDIKKTEMVISENFTCAASLENAFEHIKKFDNAIDIGTWIGDSTVIMSKKFKIVLGFEANPIVYKCCLKNLKEKNIKNCQISNYGVSNITGTQHFLNKTNTWSGWIDTINDTSRTGINVNTIKLDDLKLTDIDFLKIDVDSHEGFLLEGAKDFFKNNNPVILIEIKKSVHFRQNSQMSDPFEILKDLGYNLVSSISKADYLFSREHKNETN